MCSFSSRDHGNHQPTRSKPITDVPSLLQLKLLLLPVTCSHSHVYGLAGCHHAAYRPQPERRLPLVLLSWLLQQLLSCPAVTILPFIYVACRYCSSYCLIRTLCGYSLGSLLWTSFHFFGARMRAKKYEWTNLVMRASNNMSTAISMNGLELQKCVWRSAIAVAVAVAVVVNANILGK